ncbi:MAG: M48 family metallopeptidase [Desulfobacterales bacterium]
MKIRSVRTLIVALTACAVIAACSTVPITGREQLTLIPESQVISLSLDQYRQFLSEADVVTGTDEARTVQRVGSDIRAAVESYLRDQGMQELITGYNWEFILVEDENANAFAMPGGKVVVFSGIMDIAQTEAGLATVIGHEVAHAIARHGNERMSQALLAQLGGQALAIALQERPQQTQQLFMAAYGLGAQVGILMPYSRLQESEADKLGLIFMAMAGYNPAAAIDFWQRMESKKEGGAPPEFLSTHPSHGTRIQDIREYLPTAMSYYR